MFEAFPDLLKLRCQLVAMRLRIDPGFDRGLLNFLSMFIEPGEKEDLATAQSPIASEDICGDGCIGVANVRHVVHVIDRRCDVETVGVTHVVEQKISGNKRRKLGEQRD